MKAECAALGEGVKQVLFTGAVLYFSAQNQTHHASGFSEMTRGS